MKWASRGKVSIDAERLWIVSASLALRRFHSFMGSASGWVSPVVRYRMRSSWQRDWRIEVGQWLTLADRLGYLAAIQRLLNGAKKAVTQPTETSDVGHLVLATMLAPAMVAHYFTSTGWTFEAWEPPRPRSGIDVDVRLRAPSGCTVAFQVKACDRPARVEGGRIVDGEKDTWVRSALRKAAGQLPRPATEPAIVALCSQRNWPLASNPHVIESLLLGSSYSTDDELGVRLNPQQLDADLAHGLDVRAGEFRHGWKHVGAVLLLDLRRSDSTDYMCTVILNPWCEPAATCQRRWFPHARILWLDGTVFRWDRGEPTSYFPDGTWLESLP